MRLPFGFVAFAFLAVTGAQAQTLRGQITDSISRSPLGGAFLTLVDEHGAERARGITNHAGQFSLNAPVPGTYRIRSKRIGFRPYVSSALTLRAGETRSYDAAVDPIPIPLQQVVVAGERQCDIEAGASVAALWEEVREALAAVAWSSRAPGYWYDITNFRRELNASGRPLRADSTWREVRYQPVPFASAPVEQLAATGFVDTTAEEWTYHAPDADVLLSDPFLRTHCFETRAGRGETTGMVGLAFVPARGRQLPDVAGTLWVDRETSELHHLEFTYTQLPHGLVSPRAGGRVEFLRLPTGAWIVRDWVLRMPIARMGKAQPYRDAALEVIAFHVSGARAEQIKTTTGTVVYQRAQ